VLMYLTHIEYRGWRAGQGTASPGLFLLIPWGVVLAYARARSLAMCVCKDIFRVFADLCGELTAGRSRASARRDGIRIGRSRQRMVVSLPEQAMPDVVSRASFHGACTLGIRGWQMGAVRLLLRHRAIVAGFAIASGSFWGVQSAEAHYATRGQPPPVTGGCPPGPPRGRTRKRGLPMAGAGTYPAPVRGLLPVSAKNGFPPMSGRNRTGFGVFIPPPSYGRLCSEGAAP
jgi:hypothetical protein